MGELMWRGRVVLPWCKESGAALEQGMGVATMVIRATMAVKGSSTGQEVPQKKWRVRGSGAAQEQGRGVDTLEWYKTSYQVEYVTSSFFQSL